MSLFSQFVAAIERVRSDEGQGLAEYALILALIAIIAIVALIFLGGQVSKILSNVGNSVYSELPTNWSRTVVAERRDGPAVSTGQRMTADLPIDAVSVRRTLDPYLQKGGIDPDVQPTRRPHPRHPSR